MKKQEKILLFIPAYNCEKQIVRVLDRIDTAVMHYISEIIVVNNRSTDGTEKAVLDYKASHWSLPLKLFRNHENYGLGGSFKVAFDYAIKNGFDHVIVLHGDDQGDIQDFLPVLKKGIYRNYDCVLGARFMLQSRLEGYSLFRTVGNIVYDFLFAFATGQRIFDLGSGLNMYSVSMLKDRYYEKFPDDLTFNYCMVLALRYYNQTARFFPISWKETDQVSNVKMASQAVKVLKMLFAFVRDNGSIRGDYREKPVAVYDAEEIIG
ncbi:MAG: glycosyltransferase family 2 protein [Lachnospiraceae bacterium]|nr:glycosyltransferase family 2 protein [Lachnospiraceae bacterium]